MWLPLSFVVPKSISCSRSLSDFNDRIAIAFPALQRPPHPQKKSRMSRSRFWLELVAPARSSAWILSWMSTFLFKRCLSCAPTGWIRTNSRKWQHCRNTNIQQQAHFTSAELQLVVHFHGCQVNRRARGLHRVHLGGPGQVPRDPGSCWATKHVTSRIECFSQGLCLMLQSSPAARTCSHGLWTQWICKSA